MADATGETTEPLRVTFDRRFKLGFHGARIISDGGLLAYRELDGAFGRRRSAGKNIRHRLRGLLRHSRDVVSDSTYNYDVPIR